MAISNDKVSPRKNQINSAVENGRNQDDIKMRSSAQVLFLSIGFFFMIDSCFGEFKARVFKTVKSEGERDKKG